MNKAEQKSAIAIPLIVMIGAAIAVAGSLGGSKVGFMPVFALCGVLSFAINWVMFVPAFVYQTERYFDLTGSITYITITSVALVLTEARDPRALLVSGMVVVWAIRLGSFLFSRIQRDGKDGRFDNLKPSFPRYLMTWTLQGLWVYLTLACALAAITTSSPRPLGAFALMGAVVFLFGFGLEVVADQQKSRFRSNPENRDCFIDTGVWSWSRHPNYFGEIMLWTGVAIVGFPVLAGWQHVALISPVFVFVLLTRISGVPLLERRSLKKWGEDPDYQAYLQSTPVLVPRPLKRRSS
jgi:steroid 5-alpha reductase family enzyme